MEDYQACKDFNFEILICNPWMYNEPVILYLIQPLGESITIQRVNKIIGTKVQKIYGKTTYCLDN